MYKKSEEKTERRGTAARRGGSPSLSTRRSEIDKYPEKTRRSADARGGLPVVVFSRTRARACGFSIIGSGLAVRERCPLEVASDFSLFLPGRLRCQRDAHKQIKQKGGTRLLLSAAAAAAVVRAIWSMPRRAMLLLRRRLRPGLARGLPARRARAETTLNNLHSALRRLIRIPPYGGRGGTARGSGGARPRWLYFRNICNVF